MDGEPSREANLLQLHRGIVWRGFRKTSTLDKGVAGFSSCGLWPFIPDVFIEADFAPSMMTDDGNEHIASTSDATSPASPTTRAKLPQAVTFTSDATSAPSKATACVTSLKAYVLNVFPLPKAGPRAGKRRTPSSELLTSSPYKDLLRSKKLNWSRRRRVAQVRCLSRSRTDVSFTRENAHLQTKRHDNHSLTGRRRGLVQAAQQVCTDVSTATRCTKTHRLRIGCNATECCQWHHEKCGNNKPVCDLCV